MNDLKTIDRDLGAEFIREQIDMMKMEPYVQVGFQADGQMHDPKTEGGKSVPMVMIASVHEFGSPSRRIPERSFIRSTMDERHGEFFALTRVLIHQIVIRKTTVHKALNVLGLKITAAIKKKITDIKSPPNEPSTIKAKARKTGRARLRKAQGIEYLNLLAAYNNPLIDTGQMRASVRHVVVVGGVPIDKKAG